VVNEAEVNALAQFVRRCLEGGVTLEGQIMEASTEIREQSKRAYGHVLLDGRLMLVGLTVEIASLRQGEPGNTDTALSQRLALAAAAVQGAGVTEALISEGQYIKAAGALRQDLELLARLRELDEGLAKVGKVANIKNGPIGSGPVYGYLSGVAHLAQPEIIDTLLGQQQVGPDAFGIAIVPQFVEEVAVGLYELHVWELVELVREMVRLHLDLYGRDEALLLVIQIWRGVADQLRDAGHLKAANATQS
jgi:hypothetical protein